MSLPACSSCERCTWNPGPDCGQADDPHCPACGHCAYRHADQDPIWEALLVGMLDQHIQGEPVTLPQGVASFDAAMVDQWTIRLTMNLADGDKVTAKKSLKP